MKQVAVVGSLNMDFVAEVSTLPQRGETLLAHSFLLTPGGKGANQAYACGRLGNHTVMLGCVGADSYGDMLLDNLEQAGVDTSHMGRLSEYSTGMALITVEGSGNNTIVVIPESNQQVTPAYIDSCRQVLAQSDMVLMQMEIPLETVVYTAKLAKELGKTVVLDPAPAPEEFPEELFSYVDILTPNETELNRLLGTRYQAFTTEELIEGAAKLHAKGIPTVVVTLGAQGAFVSNQTVQKHIPASPAIAVDTTAAGDSFAAALLQQLLAGADLATAAEYANFVSSIVVTRPGAQASIPTLEEVQQLLANR